MFILLLLLAIVGLANSTNSSLANESSETSQECVPRYNKTQCVENCSCVYCYDVSGNKLSGVCLELNNTLCHQYSFNETCPDHTSSGNSKLLYLLLLLIGFCPFIIILAACMNSGNNRTFVICV
jgi:hypothetical protein